MVVEFVFGNPAATTSLGEQIAQTATVTVKN
jgi:hypothetical protein